jgi:hypothetical protein
MCVSFMCNHSCVTKELSLSKDMMLVVVNQTVESPWKKEVQVMEDITTKQFKENIWKDVQRTQRDFAKCKVRPTIPRKKTLRGHYQRSAKKRWWDFVSKNSSPRQITLTPGLTTDREWKLRMDRYVSTDTRDKESLSETNRPGLISVMRSDLLQPTLWFVPKYTSGGILLMRLQTGHLCM